MYFVWTQGFPQLHLYLLIHHEGLPSCREIHLIMELLNFALPVGNIFPSELEEVIQLGMNLYLSICIAVALPIVHHRPLPLGNIALPDPSYLVIMQSLSPPVPFRRIAQGTLGKTVHTPLELPSPKLPL